MNIPLLNLFTKAGRFWHWFAKNEGLFYHLEEDRQSKFDLLNEQLTKVNDGLSFEFSPILKDNKREFIISAEGTKALFPLVFDLIDKAPKLPRWHFIALRQPHLEYTQINTEELSLSHDDVYFRYMEDNGKIALELHMRGYEDNDAWLIMTYLFLDSIIGEYHTEMSISGIDSLLLDEDLTDDLYPITDLPKIMEEYQREWRAKAVKPLARAGHNLKNRPFSY